MGKRHEENIKNIDKLKDYEVSEAVSLLKAMGKTKFDETIEVAINLGVDPKHADQVIRGTVSLPHGTGKDVKVLVIAKGDSVDAAKDAGADYYGAEEYLEKIKGGWTDIDKIVSTPDMMPELGKLGKVLGPKGLMPNPKSGTVTMDVSKAVSELKAGMVELRVEKTGIVHTSCGKVSFDHKNLVENILTIFNALAKSRPPSVKGQFIEKISVSSTMGPGVKIDISSIG